MTALRYLVRLYVKGRTGSVREDEANFDLHEDPALRHQLELLVKAERGTLKLDLTQWRIVVHRLAGDGKAGRVLARVRVDSHGKTVVTSRGAH